MISLLFSYVVDFWLTLPGWSRGALALAAVAAVAVVVFLVGRAVWRKASAASSGLWSRLVASWDHDQVRNVLGPVVMGSVVLALAWDGLVAWAEDSPDGMGFTSPMSWFVIVAFEFVAVWLAWQRWARANAGREDNPVIALGTWALLFLAASFQWDHAQAENLNLMGSLGRASFPLILGILVEYALHSMRNDAHDADAAKKKRIIDASLKASVWVYLRSQYRMAAHPEWTAAQAVQSVRVDDARRRSLALAAVLEARPSAPERPARSGPRRVTYTPPAVRAEGGKESRRARRDDARQARQARQEGARSERRQRRDRDRWNRRVSRERARVIRALAALGVAGNPTADPMADYMRAMQVAARVDELVALEWTDRDGPLAFVRSLVTDADLAASSAADRPALAATVTEGNYGGMVNAASLGLLTAAHTAGSAHTQPAPEGEERVDAGVYGDTHRAPEPYTRTGGAEGVHMDSTWTDTHTGSGRVYEDGPRVDGHVDETPAEGSAPAPAGTGDPARHTPHEAPQGPRADEAGRDIHTARGGDGAHMDAVWTGRPVHTDEAAAEPEEDPDGDDDGPRGGGGAPAPAAPIPPQGGQITVEEAVLEAERPRPLDEVRAAMKGPSWTDVDHGGATKKDKVMALLWEYAGDKTRAREEFLRRTGEVAPPEIYRATPKGYAYIWHRELADYLVKTFADVEKVREFLGRAGVDADHEMVRQVLDTWSADHQHVVPFRQKVRT